MALFKQVLPFFDVTPALPPIAKDGPAPGNEGARDRIFRSFRLHLRPEEAERHFRHLLAEHEKLKNSGSGVDLRATAFNYFLRNRLLLEPVVVENETFRETELRAHRDRLTGLYNYARFEEELEREVARAHRYRDCLTLILLDLDDFKGLNDSLGHGAGNDLLAEMGTLLSKGLRSSDVVARLGGDEFAVLLHRARLLTGLQVAARKRQEIESRFGPGTAVLSGSSVTASFGVATLPAQARTGRALFDAADNALYHAKRTGRNRIAFGIGERLVSLRGSTARRLLEPNRF